MMVNTEKQTPGLNEHTADFFAALVSQTLDAKSLDSASKDYRSLYGGIDPRIEGGERYPVEEIKGNLEGFIDFAIGLGDSFQDEQNRYDGKPDYIGDEAAVLTNKISSGDMIPELESELIADHILDSGPRNVPGKNNHV
jgi:hypothetical protein